MTKAHYGIILAGGTSSRLYPLSDKTQLSFAGLTLIDRAIEMLQESVDSIVIVAGDSNFEALSKAHSSDSIAVVLQKGIGMAAAIESLPNDVSGSGIIVNGGDYIAKDAIVKTLEAADDADVCFPAWESKTYFPGGYIKHHDFNVEAIVEKPKETETPSNFVKLVCDYVQDLPDFVNVLRNTKSLEDNVYEEGINQLIMQGKRVKMFPYTHEFIAIKYPWHVLDVMNEVMRTQGHFIHDSADIDETVEIVGDVYIDEGAKIYEYSKIVGPTYIGKNAIVGNFALIVNSMIGPKSVIGGYSEVTRSYLGDNVWMHRAYVGDSVVEGTANFAAGAVTANFRFDGKEIKTPVKDVIVNTERTKLGIIAGRDVQLGVQSSTMPGVKLSPGARVMPHESRSKDS